MVEDLVDSVCKMCFADVQKNQTEMEEFGDATSKIIYYFSSLDLDLVSVLESKYLCHVQEVEDVKRLFSFFNRKFVEFDATFRQEHLDKGFSIVPIHRTFTYLFSRVFMKYYTCNRMQSEEVKLDVPST